MKNPHLQYARYLLRHKWFVLVAGLRTGAPLWRLIIHDWSKLRSSEWKPYAQYFYVANHADNERAFDEAWLKHQHRNAHHWQHFVLREDSGATKPLPMPEPLVREMVADWAGAGRAITGKWEVKEWYARNHHNMILHHSTRLLIYPLLDKVGKKL